MLYIQVDKNQVNCADTVCTIMLLLRSKSRISERDGEQNYDKNNTVGS